MKKVYITTGTSSYLQRIEKKFPDIPLLFLQNVEHALLFHETYGKSIFKLPRIYEIIEEAGFLPSKGFATFYYLPVLEEERPAFEHAIKKLGKTFKGSTGFIAYRILRPVKGDLYAVFSCWDKESSFKIWKKHQYLSAIWTSKNVEISKSMNYPNPTYYKGYQIGHDEEK
ncbi:antibiotic biosynthesis monooxygenase family protein [Fervidibacillus halotolerans]|uniref:Antibiotic biosynthesis monooxygenase n=1 Tax=Fervidibacillus halotolerans TaxID=2980027 RepID=A0A9E8RZC3_9BACI|nr:antibiotic biosynthesis monooxygenase [Fervidibacillus halotolerans]WAA13019.1 antibiotic biosynthesis monooxygenase [Fervidibacillus halotolerans]